jgi:hypothetical protein
VSPLLALLLIAPSQAACPARAGDLFALAASAVSAYEHLDVARFQALAAEVRTSVPCLVEPVSPEAAAEVHLVFALEAWTRREEERVDEALRALLALQPGYEPSVILAPQGSGLAGAFERARGEGSGAASPVPGRVLTVDGRPDAGLPRARAALVQYTDSAGALQSRYAWPGALDAELRLTARSGSGELSGSLTPRQARHRSRWLALAGATTGLVALVGAQQANQARASFEATDSWSDAQRYYTQNRMFALGSGVAAAGTAGLALGAAITWEW